MFFKKDLLLFLRDWKGLAVVLVSPLVLILVLGFATRGLMGDSNEALHMHVALVNEDDAASGIEHFQASLTELSIPSDAKLSIAAAANAYSPTVLLQQMLQSVEIKRYITIAEMDAQSALTALELQEVGAILTVPPNFTSDSLHKLLLQLGDGATLNITAGSSSELLLEVFEDIISGFIRTINFQSAIHYALGEPFEPGESSDLVLPTGGLDTQSAVQAISTFQYFTFSMTVLFVLFVASNVAGKAYSEKQQRVYDRIILSGSSPLRFLMAKASSTFLVAWLQLLTVFIISHLILDVFPNRTLGFWLGLCLIAAALATVVSGVGALITALNYRLNSASVGTLFAGIGVTFMAVAGGSMGPLATMPNWIAKLGMWTPNGLSLSLFIQWAHGERLSALAASISYLIIGAAVLLVLSLLVFPGKGRA